MKLNNSIINFKKIISFNPLTGRCLFIILVSSLALKYYAIESFDLSVDIICKSFLSLAVILTVLSIYLRIKISKEIKIDNIFSGPKFITNVPINSNLKIENINIPLLFSLRLTRNFKHSGAISFQHLVKGAKQVSYLNDNCVFPHRGFWEISHIDACLEDSFGLTKHSWKIPLERGIEISPQTIDIAPLPIVASSSKSGESSAESNEFSGDLYDIKPYDPADGIKKILWKTFAKSGQLISRKPEPAVVPEGEIAIFLVADKTEDYVASCCISYLKMLKENNINVLFGTDGTNTEILTDFEKIYQAINYNVWNKNAGSAKNLQEFITALKTLNNNISNIVIFGSENHNWQNNLILINNIKLNIVIVPKKLGNSDSNIPTISRFFKSRNSKQSENISLTRIPDANYFIAQQEM